MDGLNLSRGTHPLWESCLRVHWIDGRSHDQMRATVPALFSLRHTRWLPTPARPPASQPSKQQASKQASNRSTEYQLNQLNLPGISLTLFAAWKPHCLLPASTASGTKSPSLSPCRCPRILPGCHCIITATIKLCWPNAPELNRQLTLPSHLIFLTARARARV